MSNNAAIETMKSRVRTILVNDLKGVCRDQGLAVSGQKNVLQSRIISHIDRMAHTRNSLALEGIRSSLQRHNSGSLPPLSTNTASSTMRSFGSSTSGGHATSMGGALRHSSSGVQFRPSPFFEVLEPLARPTDLAPFPNHRNQVSIAFQLSHQNIDRMRNDSSMRILLYCAAKGDAASGQPSDIAFPSQLEVKVNDSEVRANFKGLKNKVGSTRPADITAFITKQPNHTNRVLTTYALTQKVGGRPFPKDSQAYTMVAMLVKKRSVDELVERIRRGKVITKEKVLAEMAMRASDPDIVVGSSVMSLKDPVSYMRIAVPCRSDICSHHQCFDAASFLQLQEQAPTWTCPICNKVISFEGLVVDQYFEDILHRTSSSIYQVTVAPNGLWDVNAVEKTSRSNGVNSEYPDEDDDDDSDDDSIEVVKPIKRESVGSNATPVTPFSMIPPTPPRASPIINSTASSAPIVPRQGQKRKSEVIDLTLSDDEAPAPKRPAYNTPNSLPDYGQRGRANGYQSYPSNPPSFSNRANGPLRFQIANSSRGGNGSGGNGGGGSIDRHYDIYNSNYDYSNSNSGGDNPFGNHSASFPASRIGHRPSPLSGSAVSPINLTESPPNRPSSALAPFSSTSGYGADQRHPPVPPTLPRLDFDTFPSPPPIPPSATHTMAANAGFGHGQQSEQRAILRQLANPFQDSRQ